MGLTPVLSPTYDHQVNGAVEKAIRDMKDHVRVMLLDVERHLGQVRLSSALFEWSVPWAEVTVGTTA